MKKLKTIFFLDIAMMILVALLLWDRKGVFVIEGILAGFGMGIGSLISKGPKE